MRTSIFEGLKIADFTSAVAGPMSTRFFALEGAMVVKVETHKNLDSVRYVAPFKDDIIGADRSSQFIFYNVSKYSISPDMNNPQAREIGKRLVKWADVIVENMTPGSMARWGIDYENCTQIKPDIIYLSSSSVGRTGPLYKYAAWGYHHGPFAGFSHLTGWPDRTPCADSTAYTDAVAPAFSIIALISALLYRRRTGKGTYIDQSQVEAGAYFLGPSILDYFANGRVAGRDGNRDPYMTPHGIFPCLGNERWIAIAVSGEEDWRKLCRVLAKEEWLQDRRFATVTARKENEDELNALIAEWTAQRMPHEAMEVLQAAGVAAGVVATTEDLFNDPQLQHREHFGRLEHKVVGPYSFEYPSYRHSRIPRQPQRPGPLLGEHNGYVLKEMLGYTEDEIAQFIIDGVLTIET